MQLLKFTDKKNKIHWINPDNISSVESGIKKETQNEKYTVLHMNSTSMPTIIIKEPPEELNKIFEKFRKRKLTLIEE